MVRTLRVQMRTFVHVAVGLLAFGPGCDQPAPRCNVAHGPFWAKYTLVSGEGDCAMLTGEELDVQSYYARRSETDPRPDYDHVSIAIQPMTITAALANAAELAMPADDDVPYAIGRFVTSKPDGDDFCRAEELAAARLRLPTVPEHAVDECTTAPEAPEYDLTYEFSRVRVYYTPAAIGTQFEAELRLTQGSCVAQYKVSAVYPMVACALAPPPPDAGVEEEPAPAPSDDAGCPAPPPETEPPAPDDSLCENAGINPDFALSCDPVQMMCVLAKEAPSLR